MKKEINDTKLTKAQKAIIEANTTPFIQGLEALRNCNTYNEVYIAGNRIDAILNMLEEEDLEDSMGQLMEDIATVCIEEEVKNYE